MDEQLEPDYFGHFDDLRWALSLPDIEAALKRERPRTAADLVRQWASLPSGWQIEPDTMGPYWLVSSLGFCRLFDTALPRDLAPVFQGSLPAEITVAALRGLTQALEHLAIEAKELQERFDDAEPVEDVALCTSLLHQLMQTWAAFIAVNDNYQEYLIAGGSPSSEFGKLMRGVLDRFDVVNDVTQRDDQMRLLAVAAELPLLESWRSMLRGPFKETLPWWLDGTLEHTAAAQAVKGDEVVRPYNTRPSPAVILRFEPAETVLQLAAAASDEVLVLTANEATELRILPNPCENLKTLLLLPAPQARIEAIEVDGKEIELVKAWDSDGEAVVRADELSAVLEGRATVSVRLAG